MTLYNMASRTNPCLRSRQTEKRGCEELFEIPPFGRNDGCKPELFEILRCAQNDGREPAKERRGGGNKHLQQENKNRRRLFVYPLRRCHSEGA